MKKGDFWGPIPVYIFQDHRHKSGHLRVMGAILSCPQPYFPSLNEIAERSGHTPKYCSKMISEMVNFGTLEREQRYRDTNIYRLISTPTTVTTVTTPTTEVDSTTVVDSDSTTVVELKESLKENKSNGMEPGYQRFCFTYPRHRLGVKRILHQYWTLNGLEKIASKIIRCVEDHKETDDWTSDSGKWVPGAQKFLEQERWIEYTDDPMAKFEED